MKTYLLIPTAVAATLPDDLYERVILANQLRIAALDSEGRETQVPIPWDATFAVDKGQLVLTGGAGPSGFGTCIVLLPLAGVCDCVALVLDTEAPVSAADEDALRTYGWVLQLED